MVSHCCIVYGHQYIILQHMAVNNWQFIPLGTNSNLSLRALLNIINMLSNLGYSWFVAAWWAVEHEAPNQMSHHENMSMIDFSWGTRTSLTIPDFSLLLLLAPGHGHGNVRGGDAAVPPHDLLHVLGVQPRVRNLLPVGDVHGQVLHLKHVDGGGHHKETWESETLGQWMN